VVGFWIDEDGGRYCKRGIEHFRKGFAWLDAKAGCRLRMLARCGAVAKAGLIVAVKRLRDVRLSRNGINPKDVVSCGWCEGWLWLGAMAWPREVNCDVRIIYCRNGVHGGEVCTCVLLRNRRICVCGVGCRLVYVIRSGEGGGRETLLPCVGRVFGRAGLRLGSEDTWILG